MNNVQTYVKESKFDSVFMRIFTILIIASIIPVLVSNTIIYKHFIAAIQQQTRDVNINVLNKANQTVELVFSETDQILEQLAHNVSIIDFATNPDSNDLRRNSVILTDLNNIIATNAYIDSIYVYSVYNDAILTSEGRSYELEDFYDKGWIEYYQSKFKGTHKLEIRRVPGAQGEEINYITILTNIPYLSGSKRGAIVVNISEEKLYNTIQGLENRGEIFVIDSNGRIISHKDKGMLYKSLKHLTYIENILKQQIGHFMQKVDDRDMLFTYVTSSYNGWKYVYTVPMEELYSSTEVVSGIIRMTTLVLVLVSLIVSFIISKGIYNPVENLMDLVLTTSKSLSSQDNLDIKDEYEFLGHVYSDVIDKNNNMEDIIKNIKPMIKEKLFTNLIMGKSNSVYEVSEKLAFLGIDFSLINFIVMVMQIDDYKEFCDKFNEKDRNLYKFKLMGLVEKIMANRYKGICIEVESDKIAVAFNFDENISLVKAQEELITMASTIKGLVAKSFPFTITSGIGRLHKDITDIGLSYDEAINALKYKIYQGKNEIININDIESQSEELYYCNSEKEKLLISNLKTGDKRNVELLIEEIVQEIFDSRNMPSAFVQQIFTSIISSLVELLISIDLTMEDVFGSGCNLYGQLSTKETLEDIKVWMLETCNAVLNRINERNIARTSKNIDKVLEYIDENISKDISLNDLANYAGLSSTYISKIFKEQIGINCIEYINRNRIGKAKQLLKNTQLTVQEIGFRVGFNNIRTFMRTFKQYEGLPPGQYRENIL